MPEADDRRHMGDPPKKAKKPPPEFDSEELRQNDIVQKWKSRSGFEDMALLSLSDKFLAMYRKDKVAKDKAKAKAAKKAKLPIPEPGPEMKNPKIDEGCFGKLLKKLKLDIPDPVQLFRAANTSRTGLLSFHEFVTVYGALRNREASSEDKVNLAFRMYDRGQSGQLHPTDVELLLEAGLASLPTSDADRTPEVRKQQVSGLLSAVVGPPGGAPQASKPWFRQGSVLPSELGAALMSPKVVNLVTPRAAETPAVCGIEKGGITPDQLVEATVLKSSRLCVIL